VVDLIGPFLRLILIDQIFRSQSQKFSVSGSPHFAKTSFSQQNVRLQIQLVQRCFMVFLDLAVAPTSSSRSKQPAFFFGNLQRTAAHTGTPAPQTAVKHPLQMDTPQLHLPTQLVNHPAPPLFFPFLKLLLDGQLQVAAQVEFDHEFLRHMRNQWSRIP
jgi:hypothetical protein